MALSNARAASRAARDPSAFTELHSTGEQLTDDQIAALTMRGPWPRNAQVVVWPAHPQTIEVAIMATMAGATPHPRP